jgi:D-alanyl-D-alanine dipeptidase
VSNSVSACSTAAPASHLAARDARQEEDDNRESFAGVLAGATHAQSRARPIHAPDKHEGTSELDGAEDADDTGEPDKGKPGKGDPTQPVTAHREALNTVDRSLTALDPALQERLARVMTRLRAETGRDVQVGETYRSQSRQNVLFAQGRTTPGPVVTWTQNSKHTQGRAVDLLVDGGAATGEAYTALQRIAGEEGLRSLGARDPGHLELPAPAASNRAATAELEQTISSTPANAPAANAVSIARVAQLAPTARVAQASVASPAQVAQVAPVARPGVSTSVNRSSVQAPLAYAPARPATAPAGTSPAVVTPAMASPDGSVDGRFGGSAEERGQKNGSEGNNAGYGAAFGVGRHSTTQFVVPAIATDAGTSAAARAAHVIATMEDAPAKPLSQIVMSVDAGNGTTDRIQLAMRGSSLSATIDAADPRAAHAMSARSNELVRALTRDGVDVESLQVRAAASVLAPSAADSSQRSSDSSSGSRFERGAQWEQQQNRQRSDDERRQQQREQRGGKE